VAEAQDVAALDDRAVVEETYGYPAEGLQGTLLPNPSCCMLVLTFHSGHCNSPGAERTTRELPSSHASCQLRSLP
jgi:hypothetical protein